MHRSKLIVDLEAYGARWCDELDIVTRFMEFVRAEPRCFERDCWVGHVTGSAWIVNPARTHVLLTHHKKLGRWLQPGGHSDGHNVTLEVALKEAAEESGLDYQRIRDIPLYQGRGCRECLGTGFRGRECITEFLDFTEDIKEMVLSRQPTSDIKAKALAAGMITLRQAAIRKVLRGVTTLREINRVSSVEKTA